LSANLLNVGLPEPKNSSNTGTFFYLQIKTFLVFMCSKRNIPYLIVFIISSFFIWSCDDDYQSSVPNYPVYLELNLTSTYPNFKNNVNQYLLFTIENRVTEIDKVGYGGILVYADFTGEYRAFDLSCPYEHNRNIRVQPNDIGQAICDSCGSVYNISYGIGNPESGPSKEMLKRYRTRESGDMLYITR
jgi:nitrite reductase/ring-hydroxylating ferredoxin subunit